ncbi:MAG: nicotinamide mononucleotide transporter [Arenicella sp.]|jgi:nicotinamide mononucleotide transporter
MLEFLQSVLQYFIDNPIELVGTIFGIICVALNLVENIWAWPTGIISVALFICIFWDANLYGDFGLHIVYLGLGFYGWYNWLYGGKKQTELRISLSKRKELLILGLVGVVCTIVLGFILDNYTKDAAYPYWDATTTCFSLIAQYQLTKKKAENWLVWIFVDFICVGVYYYKGLYIVTFLYFIYLFLATAGYFNWKRLFEKQELSQQDWSDLEEVQWKSNTK